MYTSAVRGAKPSWECQVEQNNVMIVLSGTAINIVATSDKQGMVWGEPERDPAQNGMGMSW